MCIARGVAQHLQVPRGSLTLGMVAVVCGLRPLASCICLEACTAYSRNCRTVKTNTHTQTNKQTNNHPTNQPNKQTNKKTEKKEKKKKKKTHTHTQTHWYLLVDESVSAGLLNNMTQISYLCSHACWDKPKRGGRTLVLVILGVGCPCHCKWHEIEAKTLHAKHGTSPCSCAPMLMRESSTLIEILTNIMRWKRAKLAKSIKYWAVSNLCCF